eukprot:TRINITY_DN5771_c0_g1_i1.p1 TRINITY_DN5771_c0_g1~~TRINITY_DN5771_c0_g1_i1.p1  ORF type:complete len:525 (+),score=129.54 TRINITY_DN5771_c0_g1_i1:44-1618(+)
MWLPKTRLAPRSPLAGAKRCINFAVHGANTASGRSVLKDSPVVVEFITKEHAQDMKEIWAPAISNDFDGSKGQTLLHYSSSENSPKRFLFVGLGETEKVGLPAIRSATASAYDKLKQLRLTQATIQLQLDLTGNVNPGEVLRTITNVLEQSNFGFTRHLTRDRESKVFNMEEVSLLIRSRVNISDYLVHVEAGKIFGEATNAAREFAHERGDVCNPQYMEDKAREIVNKYPGKFDIEVLDANDLERLGMNLLLSVGKGAVVPPRVVLLSYKGNEEVQVSEDPNLVALVGKGITFDTGGLNLKPSGSIEDMFLDMSGAAAILGVADALPKLDVKKNVVLVMCLAENAIGPKSYLPNSILKSLKGLTVEIGNTDAEGRLALADGLTYLQQKYKPATVIDLATLTGACVVALGEHCGGLFSNDSELAKSLQESGDKIFERVWPMPLFPEYTEEVKGTASDLKNTGKGRFGGACTAAAFLQEFIEPEVKWAHVDIAGPAMTSEKRGCVPKGGTGFGTQLLLQWLLTKE